MEMKINGKEENQNLQNKTCITRASVYVILGKEQASKTSHPKECIYISSTK